MAWNSKGLAYWNDTDTAYISVAFSWHLPEAYQLAIWFDSQGYKVKAGGPAVWVRGKYLQDVAELGTDYPEAVTKHNPNATFASRGCPVGCYFCIVPKMEGSEFTLIDDFTPRPILCDNNLSALPVDFQNHVINKYEKCKVPLMDAQSGFEPMTFNDDTYHRWKEVLRGPWRFAFDEMQEAGDVQKMMRILKSVPSYLKRVYVLIGNEPIAECFERITKVIDWGGEPHCQPYMSLNTLVRRPRVRHDWTEQKLMDMARWANRWIWRKTPIHEYKPRKNESRPFADGIKPPTSIQLPVLTN